MRGNGLRSVLAGVALAALAVVGTFAQQPAATFTPADETPEMFPDHPGRDETIGLCSACHGFKLVAAQGLDRRQWDETLDWMTEKHKMPVIEGADRKQVLDYLEAAFPARAPARQGGFQNPFTK